MLPMLKIAQKDNKAKEDGQRYQPANQYDQ
jgi:hypothetical protein